MYTVDYFIKKFEAIPKEKWIEFSLDRGDGNGCVMCFCGTKAPMGKETNVVYYTHTAEGRALIKLLNPISSPWDINDGNNLAYKQHTPKQRILAALYDVKKLTKDNSITPKTEFSPVTFSEIKETILLSNS